ncbi:hypothetical protein [Tamlana sp. I1]|uniref:hypothetical protein n=1 Tax=Tamlana sp. I1 TaxID=2762061 RepID=UPI00188FC43D|nr:hypothetical protein [Tamlana sp. I1]
MKKPFFKYFIFLFALLIVGQGQSFTVLNQDAHSAPATVSHLDFHNYSIHTQVSSSPSPASKMLDIKVDETEIEEFRNGFRKKIEFQNNVLAFLETLELFSSISDKTSVITEFVTPFIPNKRYILFEVFRI